MANTVLVLGAGVAGLTAAQELAERGFDVTLVEAAEILGGKARSIPVPGTGTNGRPDLPGEHGFRFVPGFYRHLPDTMRRIPFAGQANGVEGNLVQATRAQIARTGATDPIILAGWPESLGAALSGFGTLLTTRWGLSMRELSVFLRRLLVFATSCEERRLEQWEQVSWWDFTRAAQMSEAYQTLLAKGMTRSLVAVRAERGSARTVGTVAVQLLQDMWRTDGTFDRLLCGPTNEVWIEPWLHYLRGLGVQIRPGHRVTGLHMQAGKLHGVDVEHQGSVQTLYADDYVCALPVEKLALLVTPAMSAREPLLGTLSQLELEWMNGIQFYLRRDVPLVHGHTVYPDTPWALTSVSQQQFWRKSLRDYGDGQAHGCLSVDISDWKTPGIVYGLPAEVLQSRDQVREEVWAQLKRALHDDATAELTDADVVHWFLDPGIVMPNPSGVTNLEPLLVNTVGSWSLRPEAITRISNLFLAGDYVRTFTDLATMEAANEGARRAVNGILSARGSSAGRCPVWQLEEPAWFDSWKRRDEKRFRRGRPNFFDT